MNHEDSAVFTLLQSSS